MAGTSRSSTAVTSSSSTTTTTVAATIFWRNTRVDTSSSRFTAFHRPPAAPLVARSQSALLDIGCRRRRRLLVLRTLAGSSRGVPRPALAVLAVYFLSRICCACDCRLTNERPRERACRRHTHHSHLALWRTRACTNRTRGNTASTRLAGEIDIRETFFARRPVVFVHSQE